MSDIETFRTGGKGKDEANLLFYDANFKNWLEQAVTNTDKTKGDILTINCN
ncbi:MAG: hypothetical protein ACOH2V_01130 [Candidatus Saccharimonadaceae bacterium]